MSVRARGGIGRGKRLGLGFGRQNESALFTFQEAFATLYTHCTVQLFAFPVLIRRRCYAGKGIAVHTFPSKRGASSYFLLSRGKETENREGTMVIGETTKRCSIENATNAAIETKWLLVTEPSFLHSFFPLPLFFHV